MGRILEFIDNFNPEYSHCYSTKKMSLDDSMNEAFIQESYSEESLSLDISGKKYAETNRSNKRSVLISKNIIEKTDVPIFSYFLDGSRHTFKVDDVSVGNKIYPIIAGQIIVGCGERVDRDVFKICKVSSQIILTLPKSFFSTKRGKLEDICRKFTEDMTEHLQCFNRYAKERDLRIAKTIPYDIDGMNASYMGHEKFNNSAIAKIQNAMTDEEQRMVKMLCNEKKLSSQKYLLKDGSIQYSKSYSNNENVSAETFKYNMRSNYKNVVGVSKIFNPLLLSKNIKDIAKIIAELEPYHRTKAFRFRSNLSENQYFAVWYLRIRNLNYRETNFSDVVKCEMLLDNDNAEIDSDMIDWISANIINEAYPVCYGADARWANHLYPVYLIESFCKTQYIDKNIFLELF